MRCNNCGWENAKDQLRCVKCNAPLEGSMVKPVINNSNQEGKLDGTIKGAESPLPFLDTNNITVINEKYPDKKFEDKTKCPNCGYPLPADAKKCPNCKNNILENEDAKRIPDIRQRQKNVEGTISIYRQPKPNESVKCFLEPIPREGEQKAARLELYGEEIILNRENLEPSNNTLTSQTQAIINYEGGKWFIVDKSSTKTTFVQVDKPYELKKGDIILMGDRAFIFDR